MGHKPLHKMSNIDRAKQFAPFSALKGLEQALEKKEKEVEARLTKYKTEKTDDCADIPDED